MHRKHPIAAHAVWEWYDGTLFGFEPPEEREGPVVEHFTRIDETSQKDYTTFSEMSGKTGAWIEIDTKHVESLKEMR